MIIISRLKSRKIFRSDYKFRSDKSLIQQRKITCIPIKLTNSQNLFRILRQSLYMTEKPQARLRFLHIVPKSQLFCHRQGGLMKQHAHGIGRLPHLIQPAARVRPDQPVPVPL